ncbi:epoxide hydrolase family protein [Catellatospora bangladeshensis]|uniref:Multidrug MFS transporter n=1 Tax=Catellatospora bangladeshensis TaxID=310355 RepID=A0A8J3NKL0_9ACTN|nr:epoxide hydrolase family protein [Catellatospora bangladeshensis]GIF82781.1 multidrug MFS transporter [Catellatospora bangladeshensis]
MSVTSDAAAIRPFKVETSEADLKDMHARIMHTRWPEKETVADDTQGPTLATMQALAQYWAHDYDWYRCEARMNQYPGYLTEIDGLDFHFLHIKSKHENARPIVICHGWPGSIIEQLKLIEPLTDPTAHGGTAEDAFHVVIPSMPGYGYSGKPTEKGWGPDRIARAYGELMNRLGYDRYLAQGGDWGAIVVDLMGAQEVPGLVGIHTNMAGVVPAEIDNLFQRNVIGAADALHNLPAGLSDEERATCEQLDFTWKHVAYALQMGSRPQTLTGLADSPIFLASWLLDHDPRSMALISRSFAGVPEGLTRDDVLDNVTHFWLTNTGVSAGRLYAENAYSFFGVKGVKLPVAVSVFPDELYQAPKSWAEKAYPNLVHYNKLPKGGHFAAWEQPGYLVDEIRTGLRSVR